MGEIMSNSFVLMGLGMGTVFVFLTVLVFATQFMSGLVGKYTTEPVTAAPRQTSKASNQQNLAAVAAAAAAAYHQSKK